MAEYLSLVELGDFGNRHPSQLSGGQRQRVALARALIFEPSLVLMDEPLGALDKKLREQMQFEITRLHQQLGFTVIYVTHDQTEALTMSDRIAVFNDGVVQQCATPDELYERPGNAFVADFIGENNMVPGKVVAVEDGAVRVAISGEQHVVTQVADTGEIDAACIVSVRPEKIFLDPGESAHDNEIWRAFHRQTLCRGFHSLLLRIARWNGINREGIERHNGTEVPERRARSPDVAARRLLCVSQDAMRTTETMRASGHAY